MKGVIAAAAVAAMAGGANAIGHRHAHALFAAKRGDHLAETCKPGCTTVWKTITGEATLVPYKPTTTVAPSSTWTPAPVPTTTSTPVQLPTGVPVTCPTPGTYTIPATTVTVSETTTVCVPTTTHVVPGTHTVGGVTTVVETATTVTCPVATTVTEGGKVVSTISSTVYVCPSAGTYTIAPITTTVTSECDIEYPVPTSYNPGTYTAPEMVITVTETDYVTVCPYTSSGLTTELPAPTTVPAAPATTEAPKPVAPKPEAPKPSYAPPPQPKPEAPKAQSQHSSGSVGSNTDHFALTYTPYDSKTGDCKSSSEVALDIAAIKAGGFEAVRVYSTDCDTLPSVGDACEKQGLKMIIGVFVKETGCTYDVPEIKEQVDGIAAWAKWDMVELVVVGNEAIMNNYCSPAELSSLIKVVKSKCSGYTGPYTTAETLNIWQRSDVSEAICDCVDYAGANIHPYFNPQTTAENAGTFVQGQLDILGKICPGKKPISLETGWPTAGGCQGEACAGVSEQLTAIKSIRETCGGSVTFFSFTDDLWKAPGVEQSWGIQGCFSLL